MVLLIQVFLSTGCLDQQNSFYYAGCLFRRTLWPPSFSGVLPTAWSWARGDLRDRPHHVAVVHRGGAPCRTVPRGLRHQPMVPAGASNFKVVQHRLQAPGWVTMVGCAMKPSLQPVESLLFAACRRLWLLVGYQKPLINQHCGDVWSVK